MSKRSNNSKRYKMELYLFTAPFSTILNDPILDFKVMTLFNADYLRNATRYRHSFNGILDFHTTYSRV